MQSLFIQAHAAEFTNMSDIPELGIKTSCDVTFPSRLLRVGDEVTFYDKFRNV